VEQAAKTLAAAKATREGAQVAGADLAAMVGKPDVPIELVHRMDDAAQRQHILARRDASTNVDSSLGFLRKYATLTARHGPEFNGTVLDGLAERAAALGFGAGDMGRVVKGVRENSRRMVGEIAESNKEEMRRLYKEVYADIGETDLPEAMKLVNDPVAWEGMTKLMDNAGIVDRTGKGFLPLGALWMEVRNASAFDSELHEAMNYFIVREVISNHTVNVHSEAGRDTIFHGLSDGELAAMPYLRKGLPVPIEVPWGSLPPTTRRLAEKEVPKKGERVFELNGGRFAAINPNPLIRTHASPAATEQARMWGDMTLDPLARAAGLPKHMFKEGYSPIFYHPDTLSSMAKAGILGEETARDIAERGVHMAPDLPVPGNAMTANALLELKLPDTELYISDPRILHQIYVRQMANKIAFDPVIAKINEILDRKYKPNTGLQNEAVRKYYERFLSDVQGKTETWLDDGVRRAMAALDRMGIPDFLEASRFTQASVIRSLAHYIREPGFRPAAKMFHTFNALEFARKMGYSIKPLIMNMPQHLITTGSQMDPRYLLADYWRGMKASGSPESKAWLEAFKFGGMVDDSQKFIGTRDFSEKLLLSATGEGHPLSKALAKTVGWSGTPYSWTEKMNNLRSASLVAAASERGQVFREGVGWTQGVPLAAVERNLAMLLTGARGGNFGGRLTRPQIMRNPLGGTVFMFQTYVWRMMGLLGRQTKLSARSFPRFTAALKAGNMSEAGREFYFNTLAPFKTIAALEAFRQALKAVGVDPYSATANVLGFVPVLDQEELYESGKIRIAAEVGLGPAATEVQRTWDVVANLLATADPTNRELLSLRIGELVAHVILPAGEVQIKKVVQALLDPRIPPRDRERYQAYLIAGFKAGKIRTPADLARERSKAMRLAMPPPPRPLTP
jgi:hypothetical protein